MKNTHIKITLVLALVFHITFSNAQAKYDVTLKNDTVYNNGVPQFICNAKGSAKGSFYSLRNLDNKTEAMLILIPEKEKIKFSGTFPLLQVQYSCLYPQMEIITLLDSYIRNKVFVNGHATLIGLQAYCNERGLPLNKIQQRKVQKPGMNDSLMIARAKEDALNQVKFTFHNNANKPVRVFIGNKPKGGSGRVQIIPPHGDLNEHARKTEKIFLLNDAGDEVKSIPVTDSLKRIVIKASVDGFE